MKKAIVFMTIALALVLFPKGSLANTPDKIRLATTYLQPGLTEEDSKIISEEIHQISEDLNVRWEVILAILFQESSLKLDPQSCMKKKEHCSDYGIGQVNFKTWGVTFGWDRVKLLTDLRYSLQAMGQVLSYYKERYGKSELNWYTRYHSGTPTFRTSYMQALNRGYSKINAFLDGYQKGRSYASSHVEKNL